jgi:transcription-repair coupling factor (superfamily II helicase)
VKELIEKIQLLPSYLELLKTLQDGTAEFFLGLRRSARLPIAVSLHSSLLRPIILVTHRTNRALTLLDELELWAPGVPRLLFPEPTSLFYENVEWGENTRRERILVLTNLTSAHIPGAPKPEQPPIIVVPARALMSFTMPRREYVKSTRILKEGQKTTPEGLARNLVTCGYEPVTTVIAPGQFARRGGILDIWPPCDPSPTRLDFFGDEVDSFRKFDPATQRTTNTSKHLLVPPAREFLTTNKNRIALEENESLTEFHLPLLHSHPSNFLDYLPSNALVLIDNWDALRDTVTELEEQALSLRNDYLSESTIFNDYPIPYWTIEQIEDALSQHNTLELGPAIDEGASDLAKSFYSGQRFGGQLRPLLDHLKQVHATGQQIMIVSRQAARLQELWNENIFEITDDKQPRFIQGSLEDGWVLAPPSGVHLHLLSDGEIFGFKRPQPRHRPRVTTEPPEAPYIEFQINDLVVHIDHGIGRFKGLVQREIEGIEHEYLCVEYAEGDQLYVPVHQADRLTRYVGTKESRPRLSRLGGIEWRSVKSRVRHAVQDVAEELLELYARRKIAKGHSFSSDTPWQKELEASFPYIETDDQIRVIIEVKEDMENHIPMDRLICGDVGYGKTEIALRAAFKAVMGGKQVAMLVPTTVLAQQHYHTFRQRLTAFPVELEMLSRFRTQKEQRDILYRLANGAVDIIIGTHRLVQSDVQFKDLGLIIIDEEQRFGVTHKEHLKKLRAEVDVLTMTATPIPRTLYMALTGVRDISTISTPPEERLPIVTHIGPYSPRLVRQAILRELERGGQVFFVHNRVQTIAGMKNQLVRLVPEARISVAHGQMEEKILSKRMREFTSGELDVLISTSIIESGLDIPNANTLIVDRADTFGLAQLYQLRGRVGRGAQRAYAYFFRHPQHHPTDEARQRLETLAENTQLGAGFSISMRDLEIRGAGDVLGTRQHGHIAAVGFHLYTRLLAQAVNNLQRSGKLPKGSAATTAALYHPLINVDLPLVVNIPKTYVPDKDMRLRLYRRLADIRDIDEIEALNDEFRDRFGPLPEPVLNTFYQLKVKILAEFAGLSAVTQENGQIALRFPSLPESAPERNYPTLSPKVRTSKNTIWLSTEKNLDWKKILIDTLTTLTTPIDCSTHSQDN